MTTRVVITEVFEQRETQRCVHSASGCTLKHRTEVFHALIIEVDCDPMCAACEQDETPPVLFGVERLPKSVASRKPREIAA